MNIILATIATEVDLITNLLTSLSQYGPLGIMVAIVLFAIYKIWNAYRDDSKQYQISLLEQLDKFHMTINKLSDILSQKETLDKLRRQELLNHIEIIKKDIDAIQKELRRLGKDK